MWILREKTCFLIRLNQVQKMVTNSKKKHACVIFFFQDVDRVLICSCPFYSMKKEEGEKTQDPKIVEPTRSRLAALFA